MMINCAVQNPAIITQTLLDQDLAPVTIELNEQNLRYPADSFYRDYTDPVRIAFPSLYSTAQHCVAWPGADVTELSVALTYSIAVTRSATQTMISGLSAPTYQGVMEASKTLGNTLVRVVPDQVYMAPVAPNTIVSAQSPNNPDGRPFQYNPNDPNSFFMIDISFQNPCYAGSRAPSLNSEVIQALQTSRPNVAILSSLSTLGFPGVAYAFVLLNDGAIAGEMVRFLASTTFRPSLLNFQAAQQVCRNYIACSTDRLGSIHPILQRRIRQIRSLLPPNIRTAFYDNPDSAIKLPLLFSTIPPTLWQKYGVQPASGSDFLCPPNEFSCVNLMLDDQQFFSLVQIMQSIPFQTDLRAVPKLNDPTASSS